MHQTYVIGDIHGAFKALKQCLDRSNFNYQSDHLICLGDVCDGWPDTKWCIDELMKIENLTYILGNHDLWARDWMKTKAAEEIWKSQGGIATMASYTEGIPIAHVEFLDRALPYHILNNKLFVHAGIELHRPLVQQDLKTFAWDRTLIQKAWAVLQGEIKKDKFTEFDEVYLGHTPIPFNKPIRSCEIWMMDTGAGWTGVLSMMNVDTKEVFSSDRVPSLYPGIQGRMKNK